MRQPIPLPATATPDPAWGGKAGGLARLAAAGLPVPSTWLLPSWQPDWPEAADVRDCWRHAPGLREHLLTATAPVLGDPPADARRWAVRSSASCEDAGQHSYAGCFASLLDLDWSAVPQAVQRVRASLIADRGLGAMADADQDPRTVHMCTVLQPMQASRLAGLLATADSLRDDPEHCLLTVVTGACAGAVDGTATARVLRCDSTAEVDEDHAAVGAPDCPPTLRRRLVELGRRAADAWGRPLDIEWCWDGGEPVLLQARPLTDWRDLPPEIPSDAAVHDGRPWQRGRGGPVAPLAQAAHQAIRDGRRDGALQAVVRLDCYQETRFVHGHAYHSPLQADRLQERREAYRHLVETEQERGSDIFHGHCRPQLLALIRTIATCADGPRDATNACRYLELGRRFAYE
ncbi:MAG: PEP/pyruvate-binding domain-containing protein, partial [Planctomycetota bacterium]